MKRKQNGDITPVTCAGEGRPLDQPDELRWRLTRSGVFTVKSIYIDV